MKAAAANYWRLQLGSAVCLSQNVVVETYPLEFPQAEVRQPPGMFLRQNKRRKNGKTHRYFSVVENRRTDSGTTTQRQVLYLGEINDSQQEAWRRTLEVFDEDRRQYCELSLFPDDRPLPPGAVDAISVKLDQMQLRRPRSFGDCWLGCWLWDKLQLSSFWNNRLAESRGDVSWAKVLQLLVVNRLIDPGSELRIHRQ